MFVQVYHLGYHKWGINEGVVAYAGLLYWLSSPVLMARTLEQSVPHPQTLQPDWFSRKGAEGKQTNGVRYCWMRVLRLVLEKGAKGESILWARERP